MAEFTKLFNRVDDTNQTKLMCILMEYIFPKAATTSMLNIKSQSDELKNMTKDQLAAVFEERAKLLREEQEKTQ